MKKIVLLVTQIIFLLFLINSITFAQVWTQIGSDIDGEATGDTSGVSVSLSADGTRIAIGAIHNDGTGNEAGHVRVYSESGGVWTPISGDIDGEAAGDLAGVVSLSSDGKRVAIGAPRNSATGIDAGHVRVYSESGGVWTQVGSDIDGEFPGDFSGNSVSLSSDGRRVAIGAFGNSGGGVYRGQARVYSESGGVWTQVGSDMNGDTDGDLFGLSVSLSADGSVVAIGALAIEGTGPGYVRIYYDSGSGWVQLGSDIVGDTVPTGEDPGSMAGIVSLSGDGYRVAIGGPFSNGSGLFTGQVRVYSESGGVWTQVGSDIDGVADFDAFGISVSLSTDGKRLAVGAILNDVTGTDAGHVRVYSESGSVWTQMGNDIYGEAAHDWSGVVSLSSDGNRVAIGAPKNNGTGYNAGHVRIYEPTPVVISGFIQDDNSNPMDGVSVAFSNGGPTVTTNILGLYAATINIGWSGTSTATKGGWNFTPTNYTYTNVITNQINQNYQAEYKYIIISGYVMDGGNNPIEGVEIEFSNSGLKATTDINGYYERFINKGWTGTSMPSKEGWGFTPTHYDYSSVSTNILNQNFTAEKDHVLISGHIRDNDNLGVEGVEVVFSNGGATVTTNATGHYSSSFTNGWGGTSTATKDDWTFSPASYTYSSVTSSLTDQDYVGTDLTLAVNDYLNSLPTEFLVLPAFPNPFNPSTTIRYGLDTDSYIIVDIYDITGQLISTLYNNNQTQGWHSVIWSGTNQYGEQVPAGLYFSRIATDNEFKTTKLMLLK